MTAPTQNPDQEKARRQMMTGAMLVMGACIFGGLTAVVLMALGQRMGAGITAFVAGIAILAGVAIQVFAARKLNAKQGPAK